MEMKSLILLTLACASYAYAATAIQTAVAPTNSSTSSDPETTTPSTTTTSTAAPTTTVAPTTPPVTTPAPPAPITTPAPVPSDGRGNWTYPHDNAPCIMAYMALSSKIVYPLQTENQTGTALLTVPPSATASGSCGNTTQALALTWGSNNLSITFNKNDTSKDYYVSHITLSVLVDEKNFPNVSSKWLNSAITYDSSSLEFRTGVNQSYRCSREETLPLTMSNSTNGAVLIFNLVQLQAFHEKTAVGFGDAHDCEPITPDIVPIAVGCALAALVFVVLIAYLVGRRRSLARGYLSM